MNQRKETLHAGYHIIYMDRICIFPCDNAFLGYIGARKTKNVRDFATGGTTLGPVILGLSFAATYLSAATFLGYPGWSYDWGLSNLWLF